MPDEVFGRMMDPHANRTDRPRPVSHSCIATVADPWRAAEQIASSTTAHRTRIDSFAERPARDMRLQRVPVMMNSDPLVGHGRACPGHLAYVGTAVPSQAGCAGQARA